MEWVETTHWQNGYEQDLQHGSNGEELFGEKRLGTLTFKEFSKLRSLMSQVQMLGGCL